MNWVKISRYSFGDANTTITSAGRTEFSLSSSLGLPGTFFFQRPSVTLAALDIYAKRFNCSLSFKPKSCTDFSPGCCPVWFKKEGETKLCERSGNYCLDRGQINVRPELEPELVRSDASFYIKVPVTFEYDVSNFESIIRVTCWIEKSYTNPHIIYPTPVDWDCSGPNGRVKYCCYLVATKNIGMGTKTEFECKSITAHQLLTGRYRYRCKIGFEGEEWEVSEEGEE
ncbi:MAG TPA: hypothetical protein EYP23_02500 [Thermoplasmata archaeon]|nr:hypothetical protein [Thermoplasmata archaeon]